MQKQARHFYKQLHPQISPWSFSLVEPPYSKYPTVYWACFNAWIRVWTLLITLCAGHVLTPMCISQFKYETSSICQAIKWKASRSGRNVHTTCKISSGISSFYFLSHHWRIKNMKNLPRRVHTVQQTMPASTATHLAPWCIKSLAQSSKDCGKHLLRPTIFRYKQHIVQHLQRV